MKVILDGAGATSGGVLLVMLPGALHAAEDLVREGFVAALRQRRLQPEVAVLDAHVDRLILIGEEMRPLAEVLVGKTALDLVMSVDEAISALRETMRAGDAVLVKASNSVGLARLVEQVAGRR